MTAPAAERGIRRHGALLLLVSAAIVFFGAPLLLGRTYFFRDLYFWTFPQREHLSALERSGVLPLWDPLVYGGQPMLGNVQYWALYPTALLSLVLPPVTAVNLEIVLHFAFCAAAAYLLARTLGLGRGASAVAGGVFAFCGVTLSFGNLFSRLLAMPHTALLLVGAHRFLVSGRRVWLALAAAAGALIVFAASAEQAVFAMALTALWLLVDPNPKPNPTPRGARGRSRSPTIAIVLAAAVAGLSAVATLPTVEIVRNSWRGAGLPAAERANWSVNPRRLPELAVPGFFGETDTLRETDYWGAPAQDMGFPTFLSIYLGAPVLVLALFGAFSRSGGALTRPARALLGLVLLGSLALSLGRYLPTGGLFDPAAVLGFFRFPEKFFLAVPLPAALLAADAAEGLRRSEHARASRRVAAALLATGALLLLFAALVRLDAAFAGSFERVFFLHSDPRIASRLASRVLHAALFSGAAAILVLRLSGRRSLPAALAILASADLLSAGARVNPTAPRELLEGTPPLARRVREELGGGRFYRSVDPVGFALQAPSNEVRWRYSWNRETLAHYTPAAFGIPFLFQVAFDGLDPAPHARLTRALERLPWERRAPILSAANVTVILSADPVRADGIEPLGEVPNASSRVLRLYRNARAMGPARLVHFWRAVPSTDDAIRGMLSPGFDPRRHAVLETTAPPPPATPCAPPRVAAVASSASSSAWRTSSTCPGWLVLAEPFYPGWRARLDGRDAPIVRANAAFSAVSVPPGQHEVVREYRPRSLAIGSAVSLVTAVLLAAWASGRRRERRGPV